jgi:hypothetical protein
VPETLTKERFKLPELEIIAVFNVDEAELTVAVMFVFNAPETLTSDVFSVDETDVMPVLRFAEVLISAALRFAE